MTDDELKQQKDIEFYAANVEAWFNTQLEHDKSLLTLSAGGLGILVTLITTVGISSTEALVLYIAAILSFSVCLLVILLIFKKNASYLEAVNHGIAAPNDPCLAVLDNVASFAFALGVIVSIIIGLSAAVNSYVKVNEMTKKPVVTAMDSFNGIAKLQQPVDLRESYNHATNMQAPPSGQEAKQADKPVPVVIPKPAENTAKKE